MKNKINQEDFWFFKEFTGSIELEEYSIGDFFKLLEKRMDIRFWDQPDNARIDWQKITPHYTNFFDYKEGDLRIQKALSNSELVNHNEIIVESALNFPPFRTSTSFFISRWYELSSSLVGMGCIAVTSDYKCLLEFTDDAYSMLHTNFNMAIT